MWRMHITKWEIPAEELATYFCSVQQPSIRPSAESEHLEHAHFDYSRFSKTSVLNIREVYFPRLDLERHDSL